MLRSITRFDAGRQWSVFTDDGAVWFLFLSALLGITVGDNCWLIALKAIGTRRVILVDAIKPFVAALLAWPIFGEVVSYHTVLGMIVCMTGIVFVSLERGGAGRAAVIAAEERCKSKAASETRPPSKPRSCMRAVAGFLKRSPCETCAYVRQQPSIDSCIAASNATTKERSDGHIEDIGCEDNVTSSECDDNSGRWPSEVVRSSSPSSAAPNGGAVVEMTQRHNATSPETESGGSNGHDGADDVNIGTTENVVDTGSNSSAIGRVRDGNCPESGTSTPRCALKCHCTKEFAVGYSWATANVLLDVGAAMLTKYFGTQMNTWEIGALRFGSAAITMVLVRCGRFDTIMRPQANLCFDVASFMSGSRNRAGSSQERVDTR